MLHVHETCFVIVNICLCVMVWSSFIYLPSLKVIFKIRLGKEMKGDYFFFLY
jgi:uncharacterized integral membrane protein